jgi:hypothetical protein
LQIALSYEWVPMKNIHDLAQKPMLEVPKVSKAARQLYLRKQPAKL